MVHGLAVVLGQRTVAAVGDILAAAVQDHGVVGSDFGTEAYGALGKARGVIEDGALNPVDTTIGGTCLAVFLVTEIAPLQQLIGVPVTRGA
ncbi:hypothetical protein D3C76_1394590 [compost metagenome]